MYGTEPTLLRRQDSHRFLPSDIASLEPFLWCMESHTLEITALRALRCLPLQLLKEGLMVVCALLREEREYINFPSSRTSLEPYCGAGWESLGRWAGVLMCGLRPQPTVKSHLYQGGLSIM